jgi:hypothetical protein
MSLRRKLGPGGAVAPIEITFNGAATSPGASVMFASTLKASKFGEAITIEKPVR